MRTAFLCSGQGAQRVGMGVDFASAIPACAEVYDAASRAAGLDVLALCAEGPDEELALTQNTQPALVATSLAIAEALAGRGVRPDAVAGFSLGEYAAHAIAGTVSAEVALELVARRGRFMGEAAARTEGGMAALLRCDAAQAGELCGRYAREFGQVLVPANYNCPGQVVISGQAEALDAASRAWRESGGKVLPVATSGAFHSPLMQYAAERMSLALEMTGFAASEIPLYCNVDARPLEVGRERESLVAQITSPVLWEQTIRNMIDDGVGRFIECGPGRVLTGMVKRVARDAGADVEYLCVEKIEDLEAFSG